MDRAASAFIEPMIGFPVWGAKHGFGSFLTLEFGASSPVREGYGEWHLWIYCCNWRIVREGVELAWSESDGSSIKRAVSTLNQHCLSDISAERLAVDPHSCLMMGWRSKPGPMVAIHQKHSG
jgi:hypothetical protein